jgi:hypothetical protein
MAGFELIIYGRFWVIAKAMWNWNYSRDSDDLIMADWSFCVCGADVVV